MVVMEGNAAARRPSLHLSSLREGGRTSDSEGYFSRVSGTPAEALDSRVETSLAEGHAYGVRNDAFFGARIAKRSHWVSSEASPARATMKV